MRQVWKIIENGKVKGIVEKVDGYTDYYTAEDYARIEEEGRQVPKLSEAESMKARATLAAARAAWAAATD